MSGTERTAIGAGAIIMLMAMAAILVGASTRGPPSFEGVFSLTRVSRGDDTRWPASLASDCAGGSSRASGPAVCVGETDARGYRRGEAISARIAWRDAPAGSSIVVYLDRDDPDPERAYLGGVGALVERPIAVSGDGDLAFSWNGREFPCAPADAPMICAGTAEIGRYRLRAVLYDRDRIAIVGWPDPDPPAILAHSASSAFLVEGTPDLQPITRSLWWAALDEAMEVGEIDSSSALAGDLNGSGVEIYQIGHRLCADIAARPPYQSTLVACIPKRAVIGDAGLMMIDSRAASVTGHVSVRPGAFSRAEAIGAAQAVADVPYRPRVAFHRQPRPAEAGYDSSRDGDFHAWSRRNPHATTYLGDSVSETIYRPDLDGAWVIVVNELMAGGSVSDEQRFADKVLVLVMPDRSACVIETRPYRGAEFSRDPATAEFACP